LRERCVNFSEIAQMCIVLRPRLREIPEWRRGMPRRAAKVRAVCKTAPAQGCAATASTQMLVPTNVARLCRDRLFANLGRMPGFANDSFLV
jgi:hypothetical protein